MVLSTTASAVKKDDITISPNPTSGIINIQSKKGMQNPVVKVYNMEGRNVFSKSYQNTQNSITLDLTKELNSSKLLIVNIEADGQVKSSKVLRK
ncbi:T9SS type A sorting domain-containing protein [Kaistella anthropi]|nr:T9SS type A sorting domain-containing protein [Kaistella anthropi]